MVFLHYYNNYNQLIDYIGDIKFAFIIYLLSYLIINIYLKNKYYIQLYYTTIIKTNI